NVADIRLRLEHLSLYSCGFGADGGEIDGLTLYRIRHCDRLRRRGHDVGQHDDLSRWRHQDSEMGWLCDLEQRYRDAPLVRSNRRLRRDAAKPWVERHVQS